MRSAFYAGARALLGSVVAIVAITLMPWSPALAAPTCNLQTQPAAGEVTGATNVLVVVHSSYTNFSEAGPTNIYLYVDGGQAQLIGQNRSQGGLGASGSQTVHLALGQHRIEVECATNSGHPRVIADFNVVAAGGIVGTGGTGGTGNPGDIPPQTLLTLGIIGFIVLGGVVGLARMASGSSNPEPAVAPAPSPPPLPPASDTTPVLAGSTPQLLRDQGQSQQRTDQRCADAAAHRNDLLSLLLKKRALESEITKEWNGQSDTARALLQVYRSLCAERSYAWMATGAKNIELAALWTNKVLSFASGAGEAGLVGATAVEELKYGIEHALTDVPDGLKGELVKGTLADVDSDHLANEAKLLTHPERMITKADVLHTAQGAFEGVADKIFEHVQEISEAKVEKLNAAVEADINNYLKLAGAHNAKVDRWHAEKRALMEALDRDINAAGQAFASSFRDCHQRPFDQALQDQSDALGVVDWRAIVGEASDLEVPVDVVATLRNPFAG